ncbi:LuxR family transcriptional regulator [Pseudomonas sp. S37]|uniref:response regulator transcription factor n=1 Tax=Pseudomonas sp. S37 TaxID=2767449 RepID=UPI001913E27F|nr:helix-turn-helix transcriptional regulator [Pseudomonas sp. S37]MBK4995977.1 LuxR family transcriptional regulator [Pseudomonas sp. S37]
MSRDNYAHQAQCTALLQQFSQTVLGIQQLAQARSIEQFHGQMFERLQGLLAFDKAWWGRSATVDGELHEHSCAVFNLPASYVADWQSISADDVTVGKVHAAPGQAVIVDLNSTPGLRWLGMRHDIRELLCIIVVDPVTQLSEHLTLYRSAALPRFSQFDCELLTCLMPHLVAAMSNNQIRAMLAMRESLADRETLGLAVCDRHGILQHAESGFIEMLQGHWPHWSGPALPMTVRPGVLNVEQLRIEMSEVDGAFVLVGRARSALQRLSPREYDVARSVGRGQTYKEIARELGLAPNTVRHHIRTIYAKLGVNDKVRVARLLHAPDS